MIIHDSLPISDWFDVFHLLAAVSPKAVFEGLAELGGRRRAVPDHF
jgi:hypothetical protein